MLTPERPKVTGEEPIGIVISRGASAEAAPRLTAYVWSAAPEHVSPALRDR